MTKFSCFLSISLLGLFLGGCTLTPAHFDGEDLLDTEHKTEMQDPVIPPSHEYSDGKIIKASPAKENPVALMKGEECVKNKKQVSPPVQTTNKREFFRKGDHVRVTVFREKDLSGDYQLDGKGDMTFPLIGKVPAVGLNAAQLQDRLKKALAKGYLVNPDVTVEFLPDCNPA